MKPVMLPPGCARFAAKPLPIGSDMPANTIGIVFVSRARAPIAGVVTPKSELLKSVRSLFRAGNGPYVSKAAGSHPAAKAPFRVRKSGLRAC
jgi:hypothetical protein